MATTSSDFVGRGNLLRTLTLSDAPGGELFELVGGSGTGKTAIVHEVDRRNQGLRTIHIDLEGYDPERPGDVGEGASVGSVAASFHHFAALLTRLVDADAGPDEAQAFRDEVREAYHSEVAGRRIFSLNLAMADVQHTLSPADLAQAWRESRDRVAEAFLARWNHPGAEGGRLLVFDNVDDIIDEELGEWLGDLLPRLERSAVLLTRRSKEQSSLVASQASERLTALEVGGWDAADIETYLARRGANRLLGGAATNVWSITDGHPGTIVVMLDLLDRPGVERRVDLDELLRRARQEPGRRVAALIEGLVRAQQIDRPTTVDFGALLWRAVEAAAITRQFDSRIFAALMADEDLGGLAVKDLFEVLQGLRFVERVDRPDTAAVRARTAEVAAATTGDDPNLGTGPQVGRPDTAPAADGATVRPGDTFRLYRYVREEILDRLLAYEPERYHDLHDRAAEHHAAMLVVEDHPDVAFSYSDAFVYEDPAWQRHKREWLHHRSHAERPAERREAIRETARLFLEAFYWWGCYVHFDFCDQVISDLAAVARRRGEMGNPWPEVDRMARALDRIVQSYPPRSTKRSGDWDAVRAGLVEVAALAALRGPKDCTSATDYKIRALLDVFMAQTHRFGSPDDGLADRYYTASIVHLGRVSELTGLATGDAPEPDWNLPWFHFERAELCFDLPDGDPVKLEEQWKAAADLLQPRDGGAEAFDDLYGDAAGGGDGEPDHELIANLHRLRGDLCWRDGDPRRAATWYRRALLHAYFANASGPFADEYTLQFHVEIKARVLTRIGELLERGDEAAAVDVAVEVAGARWCDAEPDKHRHQDWRDEVVKAIDGRLPTVVLTEIADTLFLPGPTVGQLGPHRSSYAFLEKVEDARNAAAGSSSDLHDEERWP